ncbi:MAG: putative RNA binding protein [Desulfotomaculum sp. 46_296]|nr:MAG: putative RNA binding protein [Desulfotomaculum sp. 46_296]KUK84726.1 MAG: putative RNA binding protein [Desulfofundulus kuznetsovii]HAU32572.1 RNA-binding protein S1 [Desulfotomaculum sp.]
MPAKLGSVMEGIVKGITNFGAFIQLPDGETGLVHISEVARIYVRDINDFLKENDRVIVKVISIDPRGKIGLSIKQVEVMAAGESGYQKGRLAASFEEKLNKFLKESDEKQTHLRRSTEAKRGGRGSARREE